jgi:hypothetical protein
MGSGITIEGHARTSPSPTSPARSPSPATSSAPPTRTHRRPIHFHTSRTDFQLARLDGEVEISPDSDLSADQALGPVVLTTRNRNITLDRIAGDVSVTNRNGSVDLTAAPAIGNINIEDRNGSVRRRCRKRPASRHRPTPATEISTATTPYITLTPSAFILR